MCGPPPGDPVFAADAVGAVVVRGMRLNYSEIQAVTLPSADLLRADGEWERCPHCGGSGWSLT